MNKIVTSEFLMLGDTIRLRSKADGDKRAKRMHQRSHVTMPYVFVGTYPVLRQGNNIPKVITPMATHPLTLILHSIDEEAPDKTDCIIPVKGLVASQNNI